MTGADLSEKGIVFRYEKRRQKGAVYSVYAGEDIMTAYGAQVYKKGELVKEHLVTGDNGAAVLKKKSPSRNLYCEGNAGTRKLL